MNNGFQEWLDMQDGCCIPGCDEKPVTVDNMDNPFCYEHAETDVVENPENWEDDD